ncbi:threonine/serine exporter family protein [Bacillus sp. CECT 9360]|uniref:threonine/serine exporter family protein n=1 Tax=Bacillus sp. CECT 9360 TaxID=2845821 RepID=UPI001E4BDE85|nr:threonine/serine exporter family protein [Bacillus sp. CECT 9360]CAH0344950.1 Inner membrane protein YjjP [Bacillus sp. CECT 9360]
MENLPKTYEVIEVCMLAGKIMLESGAETNRVEDTMSRIAASFGIYHSHSFVTPTGIIFSIDGADPSKLYRISNRSTDLKKVTEVNSISRKISSGEISAKDALVQLKRLEKAKLAYPLWLQILAAFISSGCFLIMFQGGWHDFIPACLTGGIGFSCLIYLNRLLEIKFFSEFLSSLIIGLVATLFVYTGVGDEIDKIIIGSVMPLVPGLLITNAIRDLMAGHLVSGISKGAEASLTAFAIGSGIAVVLSFF